MCRYHNQYGHNTERCRTSRLALEKLVREGYLLEFVDRNGGANIAKDPTKRAEREDEPWLLPPLPEVPKKKIYMISGGEDERVSNQERKSTMRQVRRMEEEIMEIQSGEGSEITFGPQDDRALLRPHNNALVITIDVEGAWVARTFVDTGSSVNIMYYDYWTQLEIE